MKSEIRQDAQFGRVLWLTDGKTEVGCALDFGLRIVQYCVAGMQNLLYRQSADLSDGLTTEKGWKIWGGHRFWSAPESDLSYYPDNEAVSYELLENGVILTQNVDPWLKEQKSYRIEFLPNGDLSVEHILKNCADTAKKAAAWGVSTTAAGGYAVLPFPRTGKGDYNPKRVMSFWGNTTLCDERLQFTHDEIIASFKPSENYLKLGIYSSVGHITRYNFNQKFDISITPQPMENCADGGVNIELYMNKNVLEMETLGAFEEIAPNASVSHKEIWHVEKYLPQTETKQ